MTDQVERSLKKLEEYCIEEDFKGYDPYDGLSSRLFKSLPLIRRNRFARLVWIQGFKKSPVNLRPLVGIRKEYNPKALGLFLSGYVSLYKINPEKKYLDKIHFFTEKILKLATPGYSGLCWGYNFDWESRAFFLPEYTPTVVVSSFIASSLLDTYEVTHEIELLNAARSTCDFVLKDLNRVYDDLGNYVFSYSRFDKSSVYNASLLGSRLLARVYSFTGELFLKEEAEKSVRYVCQSQNPDGSWSYGSLPFHKWVDNFHTGYNLECISDYIKYTGDKSYTNVLEKGYQYYKTMFFTTEGISKYYNNSLYPVDIHAPAQLVITLCKLGKLHEDFDLIERVLSWTINNMQSGGGYFYYQFWKRYKIRIPYMRWSQAWMFYALSTCLYNLKSSNSDAYQKKQVMPQNHFGF